MENVQNVDYKEIVNINSDFFNNVIKNTESTRATDIFLFKQ